MMTFRNFLAQQVELGSEHRRFAVMALRDPDFSPRRFFDGAVALGERESCDHIFEAFESAWNSYTREGHGPSEDARDREMRAMLEPLLAKVKAERHGCVCSAVARRLSPLRADPGCRSREVGTALAAKTAQALRGLRRCSE